MLNNVDFAFVEAMKEFDNTTIAVEDILKIRLENSFYAPLIRWRLLPYQADNFSKINSVVTGVSTKIILFYINIAEIFTRHIFK